MGAQATKQGGQPGDKVTIGNFRLLKSIGKGAFGKVRVVEYKKNKTLYAMKYINKDKCVRMGALTLIIRERDLLEEIEHPYVVNLRFSFQNEVNMFMVMDLMIGGDLRFHIDRKRFDERVIRFWIAELCSGLSYLHHRGIVHRDVKPENILMDSKGHIALTDFNVAACIKKKNQLLYEKSGTVSYMAPELLGDEGYAFSVDWWSTGVVMYECVYKARPFVGETTGEICQSILNTPIKFPEWMGARISKECIVALKGFLERDPKKRLGCHGTNPYKEIAKTEFFKVIDWNNIETKQARPPFVPESDTSNFDIIHELEEAAAEYEEQHQVQNPRGRRKSHNMRIEAELLRANKEFLNFDYFEYMQFRGFVEKNVINPDAMMAAAAPKRVGAYKTISEFNGSDVVENAPDSSLEGKNNTPTQAAAAYNNQTPGDYPSAKDIPEVDSTITSNKSTLVKSEKNLDEKNTNNNDQTSKNDTHSEVATSNSVVPQETKALSKPASKSNENRTVILDDISEVSVEIHNKIEHVDDNGSDIDDASQRRISVSIKGLENLPEEQRVLANRYERRLENSADVDFLIKKMCDSGLTFSNPKPEDSDLDKQSDSTRTGEEPEKPITEKTESISASSPTKSGHGEQMISQGLSDLIIQNKHDLSENDKGISISTGHQHSSSQSSHSNLQEERDERDEREGSLSPSATEVQTDLGKDSDKESICSLDLHENFKPISARYMPGNVVKESFSNSKFSAINEQVDSRRNPFSKALDTEHSAKKSSPTI